MSGLKRVQVGDLSTGKPKTTMKMGVGVVRALPGCLVVRQSQRVHEEIGDLLRQLERPAASRRRSVESDGVDPCY